MDDLNAVEEFGSVAETRIAALPFCASPDDAALALFLSLALCAAEGPVLSPVLFEAALELALLLALFGAALEPRSSPVTNLKLYLFFTSFGSEATTVPEGFDDSVCFDGICCG